MKLSIAAQNQAHARAAAALTSWHCEDGRDLTLFSGESLGRLMRLELAEPVARLFRQAAKGLDPESPGFLKDGFEEGYLPGEWNSLALRREDKKAALFRAFYGLARFRAASSRSPLIIGGASNRDLWSHWLSDPAYRGLTLDFSLSYPPGLLNACRALARGAKMFDPAPIKLDAEKRGEVARLGSEMGALRARGGPRGLFVWRGKNLWPLFDRRHVEPFLRDVPRLAEKAAAYEAEFLRLRPSLVLLPQDAGCDALILRRLGRKHGVPVWFLCHGFPGGGHRFPDNLFSGDLDVDRVLAWGPGDRESYIKEGFSPKRVAIGGCPSFDRLLPLPAARPYTGVAGAHVLILGTSRAVGQTAYWEDTDEKYLTEIAPLLRRMGAARITFKLHPGRARLERYRALREKAGLSGVDILQDADFSALLEKADFVVGLVSTAVFETLLRGKDYFVVQYDPHAVPAPFALAEPYVSKTTQELEQNLRASRPIPREKILREFLDVAAGARPGHFSRRVLDELRRGAGNLA